MSKGPWTRVTKKMHEAEKELELTNVRRIAQLKRDGFWRRVESAAELHKQAVEIAEGPRDEWVRITVKVETKKVG